MAGCMSCLRKSPPPPSIPPIMGAVAGGTGWGWTRYAWLLPLRSSVALLQPMFSSRFQRQGSVTPRWMAESGQKPAAPCHRKTRVQRGVGPWGMQSHAEPWRCRERGAGQLLVGPARVACGPQDAVGAEGKRHLPMLKKLLGWGGGGWHPAPLGHSWDPVDEPLAHPGSLALGGRGWPWGAASRVPGRGLWDASPEGARGRWRNGWQGAGHGWENGVQKASCTCVCVRAWRSRWGCGLCCPGGFW